MFDVERHHDEIVVNYDGWLDVSLSPDGDTSYLVISLKEARELSEKLLDATVVGSFEFLRFLTTPAVDPEDG